MKQKKLKNFRLPLGVAEGIVAIGILFVLVIVIIVIKLFNSAEETPEISLGTISAETAPKELLSPEVTLPIQITDGITLTDLYAADAKFPEDGSNTDSENLLCAVVKNDSDKTLEYLAFTLTCGTETYDFSITTLPPSCEVYVFEKSAAQAPEKITAVSAECQVELFFTEEQTLMDDELAFTIKDGTIDIKNITDAPIDHEIQVYYKNTENLAYFGGITYFLRVPAGLKPGETYSGYAANASKNRTEVMFVKYGN